MSLFYLSPRVLPISLDPPWSILLLWRSWAVRRILVHRVIVSLILASCQARESVTMVRRTLVTSPRSSIHAHRAILVFTRAKMCGHLPLVCSIKWPLGKPQASFQRFSSHQGISWVSVRQAALPFLLHNLIQRANVTWFMMTFGLVGIRTPFNPKKHWWVDRWSM